MTVYLLCYAAAYLFAKSGHNYLAGTGLVAAACYLYYRDYRQSGNLLHLRGLFALSWIGGQGLACLKLSRLGMDWTLMTWLCFLAAFVGFYGVFSALQYYQGEMDREPLRFKDFRSSEQSVFFCACGITAVSLGCFAVEAAALGYIPLFLKGVPHAYSYFHLTGIHYFTVACVLVPALSVLYFTSNRGRNRTRTWILLVLDAIALLIPILCVSRFQLILAVFLAVLTYILVDNRLNLWYAVGALAALVPVYLILTVARSHDASYLNQIFEMKREGTPLFISQPYMYITNNYDNFNCLVEGLAGHTFGMKMLTPLWTLTGLKFAFPFLTDFVPYVTKAELSTLTLFYDSYYDFGMIGVLLLSCLLGAASYYLTRMLRNSKNPVSCLLYAQFALYLMLSFFTTWFSNPTTWFYLVLTAVAAFVVERKWGIVR